MLNNFIYAKTKSLFEEALNNGEVLNEAIVFIEDTKEIWNHGTYFGKTSSVDLSEYPKKSELPTKTSELTNDSGFITIDDVPTESLLKTYTFLMSSNEDHLLYTITQEELEKIQNADIVYIFIDNSKNKIQLTSKIENDYITFLGYDLNLYPNIVVIINIIIHKISDNIEVVILLDSISIDDYISDLNVSYAIGVSEEFVDGAEIGIVENFDLILDSAFSNIRPIILQLTNTNNDKAVSLHGPYIYTSSNDEISIKFIGEFNDLTIECVLSSENSYLSGTLHVKSILGEGNLTVTTEANVQAVDTTDEIEDVETNTYVKYVALTLTDELKALVRENIGVNNQVTVDLSNYYTKEEIDSLLGDINTILESIINS